MTWFGSTRKATRVGAVVLASVASVQVLGGRAFAQEPERIPGEVVRFSAQYDDEHGPANLLDGQPDVAWWAASGPPHTLVVELPGEYLISRLGFDNSASGIMNRHPAKEVRVEASTEGVDLGYEEVGTFTLEMDGASQSFDLESPVRARWIKLTILSNYGYIQTSLAEFRAVGTPAPSGGAGGSEAGESGGVVNVATLEAGARLVSFSSQYDDGDSRAANVLDGRADIRWIAEKPPQTVVVELPDEHLLSRLSFDNSEGGYEGASAREVRVEASVEGVDVGYEDVGTFTLGQGDVARGFRLESPVQARWLRVTVLSNHGHLFYTSLAEFRALGASTPERTVDVERPKNVAALEAGARLAGFSNQYDDQEGRAADALDGRPDVRWIADRPPQTLLVELPGEHLISRLSFDASEGGYRRASAREVRVEASVEGERAGYEAVGTFTLEQGRVAQGFRLESPVRARWLRVTVLSNHGHPHYVSLAEFRALGLPAPEGARRTERGFQLTLPTEVLFGVDESSLGPDAEAALAEVLSVLLEYPEAEVLIEGHTDATGTPEHNQELSEARAASVRDWLESQRGSAEWRFQVAGHGETRPVASNDTPEGRQRNRRVEITIVRDGGEGSPGEP